MQAVRRTFGARLGWAEGRRGAVSACLRPAGAADPAGAHSVNVISAAPTFVGFKNTQVSK